MQWQLLEKTPPNDNYKECSSNLKPSKPKEPIENLRRVIFQETHDL